MQIERLHVSGSLTLKNAGITSLDIRFPSPITIILGTNGCGKSLTLSYLNPAPAPTTTFANWGSREVYYHTDHGTYAVDTDYSANSSPHRFIGPDGENLNIGQTTRMQEQLCESELGLDEFSIGLMMNTPTLVKRTEGQRKSFLMNITPTSIGFILDQQKEVEKKIRDTTANITRLQERKLQLEQDLMSDTTIGDLEDEEQTHQAYLEAIQKRLWDIEQADRSDPADLRNPDFDGIDEMTDMIRSIGESARDFVALKISPTDIPDKISEIDRAIAHKEGIASSRTTQIVEIRSALSQTEQRIAELGVKAELESTLRQIDEISEIISENTSTPAPPMMITKQELDTCLTMRREIEDALSDFLQTSTAIYSRKKLSIKERYWTIYSREGDRLRNRLYSIPDQISEIRSEIKIKTSDIPSPCSGEACPLFRGCVKKESRLNKDILSLQDEETDIQRKLVWHDRYRAVYHPIIQEQKSLHGKLSKLWALGLKNPVLQSLLRQDNILAILRHSPIKIYRDMCVIEDQIAWAYRKSVLQDELTSLHTAVSKFKAAGEGDVAALEQSIKKEETRLSEQISGLEEVERSILTSREEKATYTHWHSLFRTLSDYADFSEEHRKLNLRWIKRQIRAKQKAVLKEHQKDRLARIGDIRKVLRDQALLKSRYEEEVISQLTTLERERTVLRKVCHELTMAPREYMVPFINSVLKIVNGWIAQYWTQKIEFILWDVNEELNYQFPHTKNGNLVKDMDHGSEGERDLFILLFNLGFRIVRGKTDLPLCLDEVGRTFDEKHKRNLVRLLTYVMDQKWASQMIIVNHDPMVHEGFLHADVVVLNGENIHTPELYNEHVEIT